MSRRVLVVAAHADDEVLGCGGAIARHAGRGDDVFALRLTDGVSSRDGVSEGSGAADDRLRAAREASEVLGFEWVAAADFPDNAVDSVPRLEVTKFVEEAAEEVEPDLVYAHHPGDLNIDHRRAFEAALTAFRPLPDEAPVELRTFEVPSSTEWAGGHCGGTFQPDLYVDVSETWAMKIRAVEAYDEEMRSAPHPRSATVLDALARRRGSEAGLDRAEAFTTIRRVIE